MMSDELDSAKRASGKGHAHVNADQFADHVDDDADGQCPMCGGPSNVLGQLGRTTHMRCQNCGWDHHD
jgi:hypothetical protein